MSMEPKLYRRRYYPKETIFLKDDVILFHTEEIIVTSWNTLKPRKDFSHGFSAYFLDKGFKVSKMLTEQNKLVYWYCDIIRTNYIPDKNMYVFEDLLADVIIYENGTVKVVDLDEISELIDTEQISIDTVSLALRTLNSLLELIYSGSFRHLQTFIDEYALDIF